MMVKNSPFVVWTPKVSEPWLFNSDQKPKCGTTRLFYEMLLADDPLELCNKHHISLEEMCVAMNFETTVRNRAQQKELRDYVVKLTRWTIKGLKEIEMTGQVNDLPPLFKASL